MMRSRPLVRRSGFTLPELLIACALSGLVLTLAMNGFSSLNKMTNLTQSRVKGRQMGAEALPRLSGLMRNANIFFYTGRPLANADMTQPATVGRLGEKVDGSNDPVTSQVPASLLTLANPGKTRYDFTGADQSGYPSDANQIFDIAKFRFLEPSGGAGFLSFTNSEALRVCQYRRVGGATPEALHADYFPSPLAYFAIANMNNIVNNPSSGTGDNLVAALPTSWNFYVLYLAPMNLANGDANLAYNDGPTSPDLFPPKTGFTTYQMRGRNRFPLQLRLLTIPMVHCSDPTATAQLPGTTGPENMQGRALSPTGSGEILDPPFDYKPTNKPNYDPLPIPWTLNSTSFLNSSYFYQNSSGAVQAQAGSGPRINDTIANLHSNFNQLGNDPPTDKVLTTRINGTGPRFTVTDKVLVDYIDPDSTSGTSVRFVNNIQEPTDGAAAGTYMRYVNTIGTIQSTSTKSIGSDYLYNHYWGRTGQAASGNVTGNGPKVLPRRLLLSITTRYRTTRQLPFQFNTVSTEIDLEGVFNYAKLRPTRL